MAIKRAILLWGIDVADAVYTAAVSDVQGEVMNVVVARQFP